MYLLTLVARLLLLALVPQTLARARFPRLGLALRLRPIVVRSPNCSARDRRLCLRCNLAFWAVPAKSRRRLQQHRWYRRLHQGWTLVLNQLHQLPLPLPLLTTSFPHWLYTHRDQRLNTYVRRPMYRPIQPNHPSIPLASSFTQHRLALVARPCSILNLPTINQALPQLAVGLCCRLALSSKAPIPS